MPSLFKSIADGILIPVRCRLALCQSLSSNLSKDPFPWQAHSVTHQRSKWPGRTQRFRMKSDQILINCSRQSKGWHDSRAKISSPFHMPLAGRMGSLGVGPHQICSLGVTQFWILLWCKSSWQGVTGQPGWGFQAGRDPNSSMGHPMTYAPLRPLWFCRNSRKFLSRKGGKTPTSWEKEFFWQHFSSRKMVQVLTVKLLQ